MIDNKKEFTMTMTKENKRAICNAMFEAIGMGESEKIIVDNIEFNLLFKEGDYYQNIVDDLYYRLEHTEFKSGYNYNINIEVSEYYTFDGENTDSIDSCSSSDIVITSSKICNK